MRRGPYQLMRSSEAFWLNLSNFMSILSQVCPRKCLLWTYLIHLLFVQICTDAPTWDQGQGETALLVSQKWRDTLSTSDCTSQEVESEICPSCHIHNTLFNSSEKWKWWWQHLFCQEIEEMIITVDKNQDGKISYSEFRVRWTCSNFHFTSKDILYPGKGMMWWLQWYGWLTNKTKYQRLPLLLGDVGRLAFDHSRGGPPNCQSVRKLWMFLKSHEGCEHESVMRKNLNSTGYRQYMLLL